MVETVIIALVVALILQAMVWGDFFSDHGRTH